MAFATAMRNAVGRASTASTLVTALLLAPPAAGRHGPRSDACLFELPCHSPPAGTAGCRHGPCNAMCGDGIIQHTRSITTYDTHALTRPRKNTQHVVAFNLPKHVRFGSLLFIGSLNLFRGPRA